MLSPTLNYSLTACLHHVKSACKTLMAQLHQNLCGVPKKGTSTSHFLAGTTLWVSHKLKTNPILFLLFSFFLLYRQWGEGESDWKTDFARFLEACPSFFSGNSAFFVRKEGNRFPSKLRASRHPNILTDGHPLLGWPCVGGVLYTRRFLFGDLHSALRKACPKVAIFPPFFACGEAVFFISQRVDRKSC